MGNTKPRADVKGIVGSNLRALIKARDRSVNDACARLGMKPTQVKRIMGGMHAITLSTIERIAAAYDLHAYQLLIPGLDPANPQVLRYLNAAEERLYRALEDARQAKAAIASPPEDR